MWHWVLLTNRGLKPSLHILDNECPNVLKTFTKEVKEKFQLFPPHIHCINSSERAVRSFKEHFISGLACTHNYFPLHIWCRLLPHASLAINLLRQSRMNQILSGYDQLHGGFNYNATPLAPAWNTINYSWKTNCESNLGITWSKMMVSCSLNETLYVTLGICRQNKRVVGLILRWIFPTQYSTPLQLFLRKFHHCSKQIIPCPEEPSTPSAIFQNRRLPNGRNWATPRYIFQGGR